MEATTDAFSRVDEDGTVQVREGENWRPVGSFPDGTPEEALAYFTRKFDELEAGVSLAEQRLKAGAALRDVVKQVAKLEGDLVEPSAAGNLDALRARVAALREALPALEAAQEEANKAVLEEALVIREKIVVEMEALAAKDPEKIQWKQATVTVTRLFESWQTHQQNGPKIPKKTADALWARFREARGAVEKGRRAYFHELDKRSKEAKTVKKDLIAQAEALASKGAQAIPGYRALLEKWKAAPRASKSVEDALWAQFKKAGDALYQAKAEEARADDEKNAVNLEAKTALLDEFADILTLQDKAQASARLRLFHTRFAGIGPVPKKDVRGIDDRVKKLDTHVRTLEQEFWSRNDPEKQARSQSMADQLHLAIAKLELELSASSGSEKSRVEAELETKRAWLAVIDK